MRKYTFRMLSNLFRCIDALLPIELLGWWIMLLGRIRLWHFPHVAMEMGNILRIAKRDRRVSFLSGVYK